MERSDGVKDVVNGILEKIFGKNTKQYIKKGICIRCGRDKDLYYSEAGKREFEISGLCEYCFDKIFE